MVEVPRARWGIARLPAPSPVLGVLSVDRIGFDRPAPILDPAYRSPAFNPAH
jgi:hypothetical protein